MMQIIYGWHGSGENWVHVPDESPTNEFYQPSHHSFLGYIKNACQTCGQLLEADEHRLSDPTWTTKLYVGRVHTKVNHYQSTTTVKMNGKVIMESTAYHLTCLECGEES
jgi:predicted RNA-binding Zn-ribbon protein involved in translation (DUF1610 family)